MAARFAVVGAIGAMGVTNIACSSSTSSTRSAQSAPVEPTVTTEVAPTNGQLASADQARFDSARAWKDLEAQVSFGPRPAGSAALQKTREYLLSELKNAGLEPQQQIFIARTPLGETSMANVIATIPG